MRRALGVLLAILLAPVALEFAARFGGDAWTDAALEARLDELEERAGAPAGGAPGAADPAAERSPGDLSLNPWAGFFRRNDRRRLGIELERLADGSAASSFDVYVVGGCAAPQLGGKPGAEILAEQLADLPAVGGREVRVVPFGGVDWKQPQHTLWLDWLLCLGLQPDAVILIDGFAELAVEGQNTARGTHPTYPAAKQWARLTDRLANEPTLLDPVLEFRRRQRLLGRDVQRARAEPPSSSAFLRGRLLGRLARREEDLDRARRDLDAAFADRSDASLLRGPSAAVGATPADAAARWADGSRQMRALCQAFGARFVHVLQPALNDSTTRAPSEDERAAAGPPGRPRAVNVRAGYPLLRAGLAELAAEGTTTVDTSAVFADVRETVFAGDCRCTEAGARRLAERVAAGLRAAW